MPAADVVSGGAGFDLVSYLGSTAPLNLSLDDVANDGENCPGPTCEGDDIASDAEWLQGGDKRDTLVGTSGHQVLDGRDGNNTIRGGPGNDLLIGGKGADDFFGGSGVDTVSYSGHLTRVRATLDGIADDGSLGEGDHIRSDVENLVGSFHNDTLIGDDGPNHLTGSLGDDTLRGLGGNDVLEPDSGTDTVVGGPGLDTATFASENVGITANLTTGVATGDGTDSLDTIERLVGSANNDHLTGSSLANVLKGGAGEDQLRGLAGNDRLIGGPGDDSLNGGPDVDTCQQGPGTGPVVACEH